MKLKTEPATRWLRDPINLSRHRPNQNADLTLIKRRSNFSSCHIFQRFIHTIPFGRMYSDSSLHPRPSRHRRSAVHNMLATIQTLGVLSRRLNLSPKVADGGWVVLAEGLQDVSPVLRCSARFPGGRSGDQALHKAWEECLH